MYNEYRAAAEKLASARICGFDSHPFRKSYIINYKTKAVVDVTENKEGLELKKFSDFLDFFLPEEQHIYHLGDTALKYFCMAQVQVRLSAASPRFSEPGGFDTSGKVTFYQYSADDLRYFKLIEVSPLRDLKLVYNHLEILADIYSELLPKWRAGKD
ncbi:MAG: hypothetical protein A3B27_02755 [Candidatus Taylorbacteria bacterium RIFCSPLOWO2_01_FULL_50_130]|nr:MAG: hypothetical protein A3B27_02755 [Candidatus Taylorbacteria bacterium RIFCSPLOWO2_01_FULL_50_130]OHA47697.1 MAG: hypothetical protein A3G61_01980 [Candidatus Taylorbacteria bacterium RIFCSPLOWO2_12_FULL_49_67]